MARVLVTGASGLVGAATVARLEQSGHTAVGMSRNRRADRPGDIAADLLRPGDYESALSDVDTVIHLAAVTGRAPADTYTRVNDEGTQTLLTACRERGVRQVLFCSSIAAGFPDRRRYFYAESKVAAERRVHDAGIPFTIIRPTIVAGPGSQVMERLSQLARLPIVPAFGGGRARVQPIVATDLGLLIADIVGAGRFRNETLELGGPEVLSIRDLLERMRHRATGGRPLFLPIPLSPMIALLGLAERFVYDQLPVTVGQLATFRFDGTAKPNDLWEARRHQLQNIEQMLAQEASPS